MPPQNPDDTVVFSYDDNESPFKPIMNSQETQIAQELQDKEEELKKREKALLELEQRLNEKQLKQ